MQGWSILSGIWVVAAITIVNGQATVDQQRTTPQAVSVQWASRVVGVSSEKKGEPYGEQYKASQALGRPSKILEMGESPCAWSPYYADGTADEWIQVGFEKPMAARQIIIAENVNPGAVVKVIIIDEKGTQHTIYQIETIQARPDPFLRIFPKDSAYLCTQIKVIINGLTLKGPNQIDAIGITESTIPVSVSINLAKDIPKEIVRENLGPNINTKEQETAPVISPDGRTLYFTHATLKAKNELADQNVWYSTLGPNGIWNKAEDIGSPINNNDQNAICSSAINGKTLYLVNVYHPSGSMSPGLSRTMKTPKGWSFPTECKIKNYYNLPNDYYRTDIPESKKFPYAEYFISSDEKVGILSIRRKDTIGDRDLYVIFQQTDQTWSEPLSLGKTVNTADTEFSPFLAADGKTLYFTTRGYAGYGNADIFLSHRLDDSWTNWSEPENLGPAINTPKWDGYFTIPASGDYAYMCSTENSLGEDDIFRLKLYPAIKPDPVAIISGQVLDAQSKKPVASEVASGLLGENKEVAKVDYNPETGEYKMILPTQKVYNLKAKKDGYFTASEMLDLSKDKRFRDIRRNLYLVKIEAGQKIVMRDVLFQQSHVVLLPGADAASD